MKKEKQVRTYQRRTKSGKMVTVKAHTAKYDAAEKAKGAAKKKGAGGELEERMKKKPAQLEIPFDKEEEKKVLDEVKEKEKPAEKKEAKKTSKKETAKKEKKVRPVGTGTNGPEPKKKAEKTTKAKSASSEPAFTAAEFKEWYNGTGSAADKKVAKALRAQLGRSGYRKLEDEAIDNYTSRGHLKMFKSLGSMGNSSTSGSASATKKPKGEKQTMTSKTSTHPKDLTDEALRDMMKKSGDYSFKKNGEIWYKSNGKPMWKTSVDAYRKNLMGEHKEKSAAQGLKKYAKEYGFSEKDIPTLAMAGGSRPKRKISEVSAKAAKNYANFEGIPLRQAKLELMMASKKEHDEWGAPKR